MTVGLPDPPFFGVKEQKCTISYIGGNEALESQVPKLRNLSELVRPLSRNSDPNLTRNEYVYAICCWPEEAGDVITGGNVKTIEGYAELNFEFASFSSFWYIQRNHFVTTAAAAEADIDDSIKRKRTRVSLTKWILIIVIQLQSLPLKSLLHCTEWRKNY